MIRELRPRRVIQSALAGIALVALIAACAPDPEPDLGAGDSGAGEEQTTAPSTEPTIAEECPPETGSPEIPSNWPSEIVTTVGGDDGIEPVEIGLTEVINASCFTLDSSYASGLDIPIPELGTLTTLPAAIVQYRPSGPPPDVDQPDQAWWGGDVVKVCVALADSRQTCTNIAVQVLRNEVTALQNRFEVDSSPALMSPPSRAGMTDEGVSPGGAARVQDMYAAEWALGLVAATLDQEQVAENLHRTCETKGVSPEALMTAGQELLDTYPDLVDPSVHAIAATMGEEPDADLSARANTALAAVEAWSYCEIQ